MPYLIRTVNVNGAPAQLASLSESHVSLQDVGSPPPLGAACNLTVETKLMGRRVPIRLTGEVVQTHDSSIEVMFTPPTRNWRKIVEFLTRNRV